MKKNIKKIFASFLVVLMIITSTFTSFADTQPIINEEELSGDYAQAIVRMAMSIVKSNYKYDISDEELLSNVISTILKEHPEIWESAFRGIYDNLDEHSTYFTKEEYKSFTDNLSGEVCGIGVAILEF